MIRCEHIYKSFDGKPVLEDISATFLPGEINMIIGRSGSGKTVLIKSIAGLFPGGRPARLFHCGREHPLSA